jgi:hypothetical protein
MECVQKSVYNELKALESILDDAKLKKLGDVFSGE